MQDLDEVQFTGLLDRHVAPTFERLQRILGLDMIHMPDVHPCFERSLSFYYPEFNMAMITPAGLCLANIPRHLADYELAINELTQLHLASVFMPLILKQVNDHEFMVKREAANDNDPRMSLVGSCQVNAVALLAWRCYADTFQIRDPLVLDPASYLTVVSDELSRVLRKEAALNELNPLIVGNAVMNFYSALFFELWSRTDDSLDLGRWLVDFDLEQIPRSDFNWCSFELQCLRDRSFYLNPRAQSYEM